MPNYHDVTAPAHRWKTAIDKADEFEESCPDQLSTVRYENLVSNPKKFARQVFEFIEIDYPGCSCL